MVLVERPGYSGTRHILSQELLHIAGASPTLSLDVMEYFVTVPELLGRPNKCLLKPFIYREHVYKYIVEAICDSGVTI